jgi:glutaminyl-tRNA synthetase
MSPCSSTPSARISTPAPCAAWPCCGRSRSSSPIIPPGQVEELTASTIPNDPAAGTRRLPFGRELFIERDDFMEVPPPKYFRLRPGGEVRLKYAYIIKCDEVVKDAAGQVVELRCTADLDSKTGGPNAAARSRARSTGSAPRMHRRRGAALRPALHRAEPGADGDFKTHLNPHSLEVVTAKLEPSLKDASPDHVALPVRAARPISRSTRTASPGKLVFNRTITLKDAWAKESHRSNPTSYPCASSSRAEPVFWAVIFAND